MLILIYFLLMSLSITIIILNHRNPKIYLDFCVSTSVFKNLIFVTSTKKLSILKLVLLRRITYFKALRAAGVVQINNKSFLYPSLPVLLYGSQETDNWCVFGEEAKNDDPQCALVLNAKKGEVVELALVNEGNNTRRFGSQVFFVKIRKDFVRRTVSTTLWYILTSCVSFVRNAISCIVS